MGLCENLGKYTPFNDTDQPRTEQFRIAKHVAKDGIDTSPYDPYRQGVEIRNNRQRFIGMMPKMWAGNSCHAIQPSAIGQPRDFVEFTDKTEFDDLMIRFDPVRYITDSHYPLPILFNEGPQQEEIASMEPFIIPFRKHDTYSNYFPRAPRGTVELGGNTHDLGHGRFGTEALEQFSYLSPSQPNPFLDEGEYFFGNVKIDGYVEPDQRETLPFDDTVDDYLVQQVSSLDVDLIETLKRMRLNLDNDIRGVYRKRSTSAGYSVYGPQAAVYGTDSVAYMGMVRGS